MLGRVPQEKVSPTWVLSETSVPPCPRVSCPPRMSQGPWVGGIIFTGGWQQVVVPAGLPPCLVSAPLPCKPSFAFSDQFCPPFSVLPQYSPEDILSPSSSSQCFSKYVPKIPIRILWGAVKSADQLNRSLRWWGPGAGISRACSGPGGALK